MQKNAYFEWDEACENNFQILKQRLVTTSILSLPVMNGDFQIYSDASIQGLSYVPMQFHSYMFQSLQL